MSDFGLIEENMERSHIHLAVNEMLCDHMMQKLVKTQKLTNNLMSSFGLIE